jgi:hypothetical protein
MPHNTSKLRFIPIAVTIIAGLVLAFGMCLHSEPDGPGISVAKYSLFYHHGWPLTFMGIGHNGKAFGPFPREVATFDSLCFTFDLGCWCVMTFAFWKRFRDWLWTFSLGSVFRWAWSAAILLLVAKTLSSRFYWGYLRLPFEYWRLPFESVDGSVAFVAEAFCYLGLFVAIDYYSQRMTERLSRWK